MARGAPVARGRDALEVFLSGAAPQGVRSEILTSWGRCRDSGISPDRLDLPISADFDPVESKLFRAARPVLLRFAERLQDTQSSLILADRHARVLGRWSGDHALDLKLERQTVVCGASLTEEVAGTNGIGTAIEEGRPAIVWGSEHFADALTSFTCIGAPLRSPTTRHVDGAINIACRHSDANSLILPIVLEIGAAIEDALYRQSTEVERTLFDHFLKWGKSSTAPIVTIGEHFFVANTPAARLLDGADQAVLWERASQAIYEGGGRDFQLLLGEENLTARCIPVEVAGHNIGAVIMLLPSALPSRRARSKASAAADGCRRELIGISRIWRDIETVTRRSATSRLPLVFVGENGTGKGTLARHAHDLSGVPGPFVTYDAALIGVEGEESWLRGLRGNLERLDGTLFVRHVEALGESAANAICGLLDTLPTISPRLMASSAERSSGDLRVQPLMDRFVVRIPVAPLRERPDDIKAFLLEFSRRMATAQAPPRFAPEAVQALLRMDWPGNVRQIESAVAALMATCRRTSIQLSDLPEDLRRQTASRHLTRLERVELEQILIALAQAGGNKVAAAKALGISRATLYRKVRTFGVELDRSMY